MCYGCGVLKMVGRTTEEIAETRFEELLLVLGSSERRADLQANVW